MAYTKLNPQPPLRDPENPAVEAPGLYPNEVAVQLDTGDLVAVFVERSWPENNAGLDFYVSARLINADGSTKRCANSHEVVVEFRHGASMAEIDAYGADAMAKEHVKAVLGEPLTQVPIPNPDPEPAPQTQPMVPWDSAFLSNVSIRAAIAAVSVGGEVTGLADLI